MRVVICGGGVIGACTAYFLSRRGIDVIVVERTEVAAAASGKAGGFLALDWCAGSPLDALARRSFALHAALPNEIAGDWGYRRMTAYGGFVVPERDARRHVPAELDWLSDGVVIAPRLGTHGNDRDRPPARVHRRHDARRAEARRRTAPRAGQRHRAARGRIDRRRASRSTAASSRRMRSSSRWGRGRCSPPDGWRCPPCSGSEVRASSMTPARTCRRRRCSSIP